MGEMPEGHPPIMPTKAPQKAADAHGDTHGAGHEEHGDHSCHSPNAPAHKVNWYQGLIGVNNEKATKGSFFDKLLYRYQNKENECDPLNQEPPVLAALINLGIVILILLKFGRKPVVDGLAARKKSIMQEIDAATELKVAAEKRLKTYEKQLAKIEERRRALQEEYRAQWEIERTRIMKDAEEKASRMRADAEFRVTQELKQAEADLLREAVESAVTAAEDVVKNKIQSSDQDRLADQYLVEIGNALKQPRAGGPS